MDKKRITTEIEYRLAKCLVYNLHENELLTDAEAETCIGRLLEFYDPPTSVLEEVGLGNE